MVAKVDNSLVQDGFQILSSRFLLFPSAAAEEAGQ